MQALILDTRFRQVCLIDAFESLIWTERYIGAGNFDLYLPMNLSTFSMIQPNYYVWMKDSDQMMIVEDRQIETEVETGAHLTISGRSLESLLDRRIIWNQTTLNSSLQYAVRRLINENVISPSIADRRIPGFIFKDSTDTAVTSKTIRAQYTGDNLYTVLETICKDNGLGFRVRFTENNQFEFSLYSGTDRSYTQNANPYVIFSPKFENIINSNYFESSKTYKNVTLVAGEDASSNRRTRIIGSASGLARRELYTDARDIQSQDGDRTLSDSEYYSLLDQRGREKLAENEYMKSFEGQIESGRPYIYGTDYFKGDIVQFINEFNMEARVRVDEIVRCQDTTGYEIYPTFSVMETDI